MKMVLLPTIKIEGANWHKLVKDWTTVQIQIQLYKGDGKLIIYLVYS